MEKVVTGFAWHITVSLDSHCPLGQKASKKTAKNLSPENKKQKGESNLGMKGKKISPRGIEPLTDGCQ